MVLKFSPLKDNSKLSWFGEGSYSLSMNAGISCPFAKECKSQAVEKDGKRTIEDGKHTKFRCYSATNEVLYKNAYEQRKHNHQEFLNVIGDFELTVKLIKDSIPKHASVIRLWVAGDFINQRMFDAFLKVAQDSTTHFYAYTKSLPFWVKRLNEIPDNFILTASKGGTKDSLIEKYGLRYCQVVQDESEAKQLNLPIDTDDTFAIMPHLKHQNFALVIHSIQPKSTRFSMAWKAQLDGKQKFYGYNKEINHAVVQNK